MEFRQKNISGVLEVFLNPLKDERGFFMRTYDSEKFSANGVEHQWVQENHSYSNRRGIIRGLHFQLPPFAETKLVRCIKGKILDVFVDLRKGSETFGQWDSVELSAEKNNLVLIPRGFAHGFCTLSDEADVLYKVDNFYSKENERGLLWSDPDLNIGWPEVNPFVSEKDKQNMTLKQFKSEYTAIENSKN